MSHEDAFVRALLAVPGEAPCVGAGLPCVLPPAFAVYRNTVIKGCVDALEANFPAVVRLVGREGFRAAAAAYAREHPPVQASLLAYGDASFGHWLQAWAGPPDGAQAGPSGRPDLGYLPGVAHLDRLWREAHGAADASPAEARGLAGWDPASLARLPLRPHPAARWAWFDNLPVYTLWAGHRQDPVPAFDDLAWRGEGALLTRPQAEVRWQPLDRAGSALLDACAQGAPLGEAAQAALDTDPACNLAELLPQLFAAGAFLQPEFPIARGDSHGPHRSDPDRKCPTACT